jgi:hypothetical protein
MLQLFMDTYRDNTKLSFGVVVAAYEPNQNHQAILDGLRFRVQEAPQLDKLKQKGASTALVNVLNM